MSLPRRGSGGNGRKPLAPASGEGGGLRCIAPASFAHTPPAPLGPSPRSTGARAFITGGLAVGVSEGSRNESSQALYANGLALSDSFTRGPGETIRPTRPPGYRGEGSNSAPFDPLAVLHGAAFGPVQARHLAGGISHELAFGQVD